MRYNLIQILLLFQLFSCNASNPEVDESSKVNKNQQIVEEKGERLGVELDLELDEELPELWDKHQFFDDLEWTTLDSLSRVIELSDSVVAYNWNGKDGNPANVQHHIVDAYGNFDSRVGKNILLNDSQKIVLKDILTDSTNYEGSHSMCFIPHIAFVYYKKSMIIGQSNICFLCSGVKSVPKSSTALSLKGINNLKKFCKYIGLEIMDDESQLTH